LDQTNPSKFSRYYDTSSRNSLWPDTTDGKTEVQQLGQVKVLVISDRPRRD
jgi:hypothetical protein